jgi:hypothetical protein
MNALLAAAAEVQGFLEARRWPFCFIGGLAVARWGMPRATQDIDLTLYAGYGGEDAFIHPLLAQFESRVAEAAAFAHRSRTLLLRTPGGVPVDVALGAIPFEERMVARATLHAFAPGAAILTCSAEDLVVLKVFAGRDRDWADVEGILARQRGRLDWDSIRRELAPLAEAREAPDIAARLEQLRRCLGG